VSDEHQQRPDLASAYATLNLLLLNSDSTESFLEELAGVAAQVIEPPASCGITVRRDRQAVTIATSDPRATIVDEVQYSAGEGPCLHAIDIAGTVAVPDLHQDHRWPTYREKALEEGIRCTLSLPLMVEERAVGAINLYGYKTAGQFHEAERARAEAFAGQASTALTLMMRRIEQTELSHQLEQALASRSVIDQALGILMAQQKCSSGEAFDLLRRHSQNNNRKLREVAAEVIARATGRPPAPPHEFGRPRS
jgi:GAF domain-containing protein